MAYFAQRQTTSSEWMVGVDGSPKGLGAVLLQKGRPVKYVSQFLTPAETGYSNTERELLSVFLLYSDWKGHTSI